MITVFIWAMKEVVFQEALQAASMFSACSEVVRAYREVDSFEAGISRAKLKFTMGEKIEELPSEELSKILYFLENKESIQCPRD